MIVPHASRAVSSTARSPAVFLLDRAIVQILSPSTPLQSRSRPRPPPDRFVDGSRSFSRRSPPRFRASLVGRFGESDRASCDFALGTAALARGGPPDREPPSPSVFALGRSCGGFSGRDDLTGGGGGTAVSTFRACSRLFGDRRLLQYRRLVGSRRLGGRWRRDRHLRLARHGRLSWHRRLLRRGKLRPTLHLLRRCPSGPFCRVLRSLRWDRLRDIQHGGRLSSDDRRSIPLRRNAGIRQLGELGSPETVYGPRWR